MSYAEYREMISSLLEQGKTTGPNQSEAYIHYTMMNQARMKRLDKTTKLLTSSRDSVKKVEADQIWLIITEAWCGDAAQVIPVIEQIASESEKVETCYVLRDEHLDLMDLFLTNGGRSIPKILVIDKSTREVFTHWGPRPEEVQAMVEVRKGEEHPEPYMEFAVKVQKWYAKDKTQSIQVEFSTALTS